MVIVRALGYRKRDGGDGRHRGTAIMNVICDNTNDTTTHTHTDTHTDTHTRTHDVQKYSFMLLNSSSSTTTAV